MAQPPKYERQNDFQDSLGTAHGTALDDDFNAARVSINATIDNLGKIQRDDGALLNGIVTPDTLASNTKQMLGNWNPVGAWEVGASYKKRDLVEHAGASYVCAANHVASDFEVDRAAGYWLVVTIEDASELTYSAEGGVDRSVRDKLLENPSVEDFDSLADAIAYAVSAGIAISVPPGTTVNIPSDAATLQQAFDHIVMRGRSGTVTISIESGYVLTEGVRIEGGDYSFFVVNSEDEDVKIAADAEFGWVSTMDLLTDILPRNEKNVFVVLRSLGPQWNILLDMETKGGNGLVVAQTSTIFVHEDKGVINAGNANFILYNSMGSFAGANFQGAGLRGVWVGNAAQADAQRVNCSGAAEHGLHISRGSTGNFQAMIATNCETGAEIRRSVVMLEGADVSGATAVGLKTTSSVVHADSLVADGCGVGIEAANASNVTAANSSVTNAGTYGIICSRSYVNATGADASGAGTFGFRANQGTLDISGSTGTLWSGNVADNINSNGIVYQ